MTEEAQKRAWYLFTDPFIAVPIHKRTRQDANNPVRTITDEQREAEFYNYVIKIRPKSTFKVDPMVRAKRMMEFSTNILPAAAMALQAMTQMKVPFNIQRYITRLAEELDMGEWIPEIFDDPEFKQRLEMIRRDGPQDAGKANPLTSKGVAQQGGSPVTRPIKSDKTERRQFAQQTAGEAQSQFQGV
jgi:hypothetical protein